LSKRILATLCVTIFLLATLATVNQVSAHYTLGNQNYYPAPSPKIGETDIAAKKYSGGLPDYPGAYPRFHLPATTDGQYGHKQGHIAFVQPGSLYVPPSDQANYYSPNGAIITDSVGDLYFYVCVSDDLLDGQTGPINISWRRTGDNTGASPLNTNSPDRGFELSKYLYIAVPPEFTPPVDWAKGSPDALTTNNGGGVSSNIQTTITNDYNFIQTGKFGSRHPVAPNWWFVRITATPIDFPADQIDEVTQLFAQDGKVFNTKYAADAAYKGNAGFLYPKDMDPWADRQMRTGDFQGCYRIKVLNMKAPTCAGKYFFKVFYTGTYQPYYDLGVVPYTS